jgi:hypothetical protein
MYAPSDGLPAVYVWFLRGSDPVLNHQWLVEGINQATDMIGKERVGIYSSHWGWVRLHNQSSSASWAQ